MATSSSTSTPVGIDAIAEVVALRACKTESRPEMTTISGAMISCAVVMLPTL